MKKFSFYFSLLFLFMFATITNGQYNKTNTEQFYANYIIERGDSTDTATDYEAEVNVDGYSVCIEYAEDRESITEDIERMEVVSGPDYIYCRLFTATGYYELIYNTVVPYLKSQNVKKEYTYRLVGMLYVPTRGNQLFFTYVRKS